MYFSKAISVWLLCDSYRDCIASYTYTTTTISTTTNDDYYDNSNNGLSLFGHSTTKKKPPTCFIENILVISFKQFYTFRLLHSLCRSRTVATQKFPY